MEVLAAVNALIAITNAAMGLMDKAGAISGLIANAQKEGRMTLTEAEWQSVVGMDDSARKKLQDAINAVGS